MKDRSLESEKRPIRFADPTADDVNQVTKILEEIVTNDISRLKQDKAEDAVKDTSYYEERIRELEI